MIINNNTIQRNKGQTTCICFSIEILEYHMNNNRKKHSHFPIVNIK